MFDLKQDATAEIRGEFNPIATSVPGLQICEHLPRMAKVMDRCTLIRSMVGMEDRHESFQTYTGRLNRNQPPGGWPAMGALLAKLQGSADPAIPASVGLAPKMGHVPWSDNGVAGYLGAAYAPFEINKGGARTIWCSMASPWIASLIAERFWGPSMASVARSTPAGSWLGLMPIPSRLLAS